MLEESLEIDMSSKLIKLNLPEDSDSINLDTSVLFALLRDLWSNSNKPLGPFPIKQNGGSIIFMFGWKVSNDLFELIVDQNNIQM